jgi:integrase
MGWDEATVQRYSSHSLRATFITLSVQAGVSTETIQKTSGHKSPQMISAYDRTSVERAAQTNYLEGASA